CALVKQMRKVLKVNIKETLEDRKISLSLIKKTPLPVKLLPDVNAR
ncbi:16334_t:CDS:2, partial [Acaulospora morrowiae]